MPADLLNVGQLVGGLIQGGAAAADPYFYTDQEKQRDALAQQQQTTAQQQTAAQLAAIQAREDTTRQAITYGLAGVLGVSTLFLASRFLK